MRRSRAGFTWMESRQSRRMRRRRMQKGRHPKRRPTRITRLSWTTSAHSDCIQVELHVAENLLSKLVGILEARVSPEEVFRQADSEAFAPCAAAITWPA